MEVIGKTIERYQPEFMKFISGSSYAILAFYQMRSVFDIKFLSSFAVSERIILFLIISFSIGELGFQIGNFITQIIAWVAFQHDKKISLEAMKNSLMKNMSFGIRNIEDEGSMSRPEILLFIESNPALKILREEIVRGGIFWRTLLGVSLLSLVYFYESSNIYLIIILIIVSLVVSLYFRMKNSSLWHECAVQIRRNKENES